MGGDLTIDVVWTWVLWPIELQKLSEFFFGESGVAYDTTHRVSIHGVVARNGKNPGAVTNHNMFALTDDPEAGLLQGADRV
jgi:hypothetical protein